MKKGIITVLSGVVAIGVFHINFSVLLHAIVALTQTYIWTNNTPEAGGSSSAVSYNAEAFFNDSIYANYYMPKQKKQKDNNATIKLPLAYALPNDLYAYRQWYISNSGAYTQFKASSGADIGLLQAWQIEDGDSAIIVAVLDGGVMAEHPDLTDRLWRNINEIPFNEIDDDSNGYVDDTIGWDFVNGDNFPNDEDGHGTNVAGIIGAQANNAIGYAGVDQQARLMICKITDENGNGKYTNWVNAIYYAVNNGARVINMSVGGLAYSAALQKAIDYAYSKNVLVVAAMMNTNTSKSYFPAALNHVLAVGATNPDDTRAAPFFWDEESGSNYGMHIDVVAPGNYIYGLSLHGDNIFWGGTSQAAPIVSGLAALLLAQNPMRTPEEIENIIKNTADDMVGNEEDTPGWDPYYGHGRINAYQALLYKSAAQAKLMQ